MKCVVVFYPHTSNWEFPIGILAKWASGIPFATSGRMRCSGGRSADCSGAGAGFRSIGGTAPASSARCVTNSSVTKTFGSSSRPKGTRSRTEHWRSGFYYLARAARVPVGLGFIDYPTRRIGVGAFVDLTGDPVADMRTIAAFYADKHGYRPEKQGPVALRDEPAPTP